MKIEEITIPAPWGHIAAKAWGSSRDEAVLVWHGLLDNAGSFDNLIQYLPKNFYYICIDLPGHGLSSNFDHRLTLFTTDYLLPFKLVCVYFKRGQYIILSHSFSAPVSIFFAIHYPECVKKLICLDAIAPFPFYPNVFIKSILEQHKLLKLLPKLEQKNKPLSYEECVQRIIDGRSRSHFKWEHAEPLVRRMVKKIDGEDKYIFTFDKRARFFINLFPNFEYIIDLYKSNPFQCPVLILLTTGFDLQIVFTPVYRYLKNAENVTIRIVEGHHDIHNTNPEILSGYISSFLSEQLRNKL